MHGAEQVVWKKGSVWELVSSGMGVRKFGKKRIKHDSLFDSNSDSRLKLALIGQIISARGDTKIFHVGSILRLILPRDD